jgi:hypothetical protein
MFTPFKVQRRSRVTPPASLQIVIRYRGSAGADEPPSYPGGLTRSRARVVAVRPAKPSSDWLGAL